MIVTVIWNDFTSDGDNAHAEAVEVRERDDGSLYIEGIVRQGMRQMGYAETLINEAIKRSYGLIGIIKGRVEWLA